MRRGSFERRLPRGRLDHKISPALLGVVMFLVILVPSLFYLFPHASDSSETYSPDLLARLELESSPSADQSSSGGKTNDNAPHIVASKSASLLATVHLLPEMSHVYLENTGSLELHQVQIVGGGRALGILSELICGEKKVLAVSDFAEELQVSALDPSGEMVQARVQYVSPAASETPTSTITRKEALKTKAAHSPIEPPRMKKPEESPLLLTITANKSEGRAGEVVGYRCLAKNLGTVELSDIRISCAGKVASTKYLPADKELFLDGDLQIENNTRLSASAQAKDARNRIYTNNTSIYIWKISQSIELEVAAPAQLHRGDRVSMQIRMKNKGAENLTDILVGDNSGEIDRIALLTPGAVRVLQKEMTVSTSLQDIVVAIAHDQTGAEVYASRNLSLSALNSSLLIQGDPGEVEIYPGEPAEVTWVLSNTGEELLRNITLEGDGKRRILKELAPGQSVKMEAIYIKNSTTWINVTAKGFDGNGFEAVGTAEVLLTSLRPGITLKLMPSEIEVCPDEVALVNVLVTNSGDDRLENVALTLNGTTLATLGSLQPDEFRVIDSKTVVSNNCTIQFEATGRDSRGRVLSDRASAKVATVVAALKIFVSSSPPAIVPGEKSLLTCTVANTGMVPLYGIFVISKRLGPLGNIEYISPKRQMTVAAEKIVSDAVDDTIIAEGFTQNKRSVRGTFRLNLKLLNSPVQVMGASNSRTSSPLQPSA